MKKQIIICIMLIVILSGLLIIIYDENKVIKIKYDNKNSSSAFFVDNGKGYVETNTVPKGKYSLNEEKSYCSGNGKIFAYDSETGKLKYSVLGEDECYIYFDIIPPDIQIAVTTDDVAGYPSANNYIPKLSCTNATATYSNKYQRLEISALQQGSTSCTLNYTPNTTTYPNLKAKVESVNTTYNDGYRYSGKEPNNWIWFNNEMWRIIGSVPVCTVATISGSSGTCTKTESNKSRLVKIIRSQSLGGLVYHRTNTSAIWGSGNTLYDLLNNYYYGKGNATGTDYCMGYSDYSYKECNYKRVGISNSANDYYSKMIERVYMNGGTVSNEASYIDAAYDLEASTVTKLTRVGLMNASDYGYATSGINYSSIALSALNSYEQNNWLYKYIYDCTMTPAGASNVLATELGGQIIISSEHIGRSIRPAIYLNSNVYIISGDGSITNPYIIGM